MILTFIFKFSNHLGTSVVVIVCTFLKIILISTKIILAVGRQFTTPTISRKIDIGMRGLILGSTSRKVSESHLLLCASILPLQTAMKSNKGIVWAIAVLLFPTQSYKMHVEHLLNIIAAVQGDGGGCSEDYSPCTPSLPLTTYSLLVVDAAADSLGGGGGRGGVRRWRS